MSQVELLTRAIGRLETLKRESTPGPWFMTMEKSQWPRVWGNQDIIDADAVAQTAGGTGNANLIVTLHRTLDAQLAILRNVVEVYRTSTPTGLRMAAVALAHAVLGDDV